MIRFLWSVLTRFSKTFGCLFIVAGLAMAASRSHQATPRINSARYRESALLSERLTRLRSQYEASQRLVMLFKGAAEFPPEFSAAAFKPDFPLRAASAGDFKKVSEQLSKVAAGRDAIKGFALNRFDTLLSEIQQKLMAHAASLKSAPADAPPQTKPAPVPTSEFADLFERDLTSAIVRIRQSSLDDAKQFLGVLQSTAENPENKKKLADSIAEVSLLAKLLPSRNDSPPSNASPAPEPREPLNAEKVSNRLSQMRENVRQSVLSSWALDVAYDRALQTTEGEQSTFANCDFRVRQLSENLHLEMAAAIAAGFILGLFFLIIGDWTKRSSTMVFDYFCKLLKDFTASPGDIYEAVERAVAVREIPGLECKRVFWHEGGAVSAKREYLQLARERLVFEIGASQFGTGFFISFRSSEIPLTIDPLGIFFVLGITGLFLLLLVNFFGLVWGGVVLVLSVSVLLFTMRAAVARGLADIDRLLMKTPLLGPLYELFLRPLTYHRIDSAAMYLNAVQLAVAEAFQAVIGEQDVPLMSEIVSPPVMESLYRR